MPELPPLAKPVPVPRRSSNPLCAVVALSRGGPGICVIDGGTPDERS